MKYFGTIRTAEKTEAFLAALAECGNVTEALRVSTLTRNTVYRWRRDDPAFCAQWDDAVASGGDSLEEEAIRRARDGWDEPVFYKGLQVATVRKFSDVLLIFLLKGAKPEKYRETPAPPEPPAARLTDADLRARIAELTKTV